MEPLVSIIIAAYNSEKTIAETIQSVIRQIYQNWEMFIVDDGSTDHNVELIENIIKNEPRIKLLKSFKNNGPAAARNIGLKEANGKYITFLDSDDIWLENFLSSSISFMQKERSLFVFSSYRRISENGRKNYGDFIVPKQVSYQMLLKTNYISCLTAVYNAEILGVRYFNTVFPIFEDYIYWLAILKEGIIAHGQSEVLALYRLRKGSVSRNKLRGIKHIWTIHRDIEGLTFSKRLYFIICYIFNGIRKNYKFMFFK